MPFRDGTGPRGEGPLTGRGLGPCGTGNYPRRFARSGRGFKVREFTRPIYTKEEEKKLLEQDLKDIEQEKKEIQKRLKEL